MHSLSLLSALLVGVAVLLQAPQPASGVCCHKITQLLAHFLNDLHLSVGLEYGTVLEGDVNVQHELCADCSVPDPFCGVGKCNIFGCNCVGGCRKKDPKACAQLKNPRRMGDDGTVKIVLKLVTSGDKNQDGDLDFAETQALLQTAGIEVTEEEFNSVDTNNDGKISHQELDSDYKA